MPEECFPLSSSQRRFWILNQLHPGSAAYHISVSLRLTGPLAVDALGRSLQAVADRHGSLRTTFDVRDGTPFQFVRSRCEIPLQVVDFSAHEAPDLEARAYAFVHAEIKKPFDLATGPLLRAALVRLEGEHHILVSTMHHIVSDGWSAELFVRELAELYTDLSAGRAPSLKPLPIQYSDFTMLQLNAIARERIQRQLSYWQRTLADAPALHDLPCDHARPEEPTYAGESRTFQLDNGLITGLVNLARRHRVTLFCLLAAVFQMLLLKHSNRRDVVIGIPVSGRTMVETEEMIGLFVNTIALRTSVAGDPSFIEILGQVRQNLLDAISHQDVPFDLIVDAVRPARSLSYNPVFQIMFATFRAAVQSRRFGQLTGTPYVVQSTTSSFDLSVNVIEGIDNTWWVQAEYNTELFDSARIDRLIKAYLALLQGVLTDVHHRLSDMRLSNEAAPPPRSVLQPMASAASSGSIRVSPTTADTAKDPKGGRIEVSANGRAIAIPFDDVERRLTEIWQRFLGIAPIGPDMDFFELGGNSLLAVAMMADLNRTRERKIPVTTLFRNPTIGQLAKCLREHSVSRSSFFPLVGTGTRPPFFVAGCNYRFRDLSRALGSDQPFFQMDAYALQEERLIAGAPLLTTIEDMAADFAREIVAVQPAGPYFLAGQCEGGIVALEIARQLQRDGHRIGALIQFDTALTGDIRDTAFRQLVLESFRRNEAPQRAMRFIRRQIRQVFDRTTDTQDQIWNIIWNAVAAYGSDKPFDGEIVLLRANGLTERTAGWGRIGALKVLDVPGYHDSFLSDQAAQAIIGRVLELLQRQISPSQPPSESNLQLRVDQR